MTWTRTATAATVAIGLLAVVSVLVGAVVLRARTPDNATSSLSCERLPTTTREDEDRRLLRRALPLDDTEPGQQVLTIAPWTDGTYWAFTEITLLETLTETFAEKREGVFEPGSDRDVKTTLVDARTGKPARLSGGEPGDAETPAPVRRDVTVGNEVWLEASDAPDRIRCVMPTNEMSRTPLVSNVLITHNRVSPPPETELSLLINRGPGAKLNIDPRQAPVTDANGLTTYREDSPVGWEWLDIHVTVDERNQLRGLHIEDRERGEVYQDLTVRPAPDHPPIKDPSGQPIVPAVR